MSEYQKPTDQKFAKDLITNAGVEAQAFLALKNSCEREGGHIPAKYRELISIAVALTTQCSYCIDVHTKQARALGVTQEELSEVVFIAAALRAGAAVGQGLLATKLFKGES